MAGRRNPKAGRGPCPCCGEPLFFRTTASQKLSYACESCDSSGFAEPGGKAHRRWADSITEPADNPPAPAPAPAAPVTRKPATPFAGLGAGG